MIRLTIKTKDQTIFVSPFQARKYLATFTNYLMEFKSQATSETFILILDVVNDNARYTECNVGTLVNLPLLSSVPMKESGFYTYTIWGQNSTTNLDPLDAVVVGECEVGTMQIIGSDAWEIPVITIPDNVVYYE